MKVTKGGLTMRLDEKCGIKEMKLTFWFQREVIPRDGVSNCSMKTLAITRDKHDPMDVLSVCS